MNPIRMMNNKIYDYDEVHEASPTRRHRSQHSLDAGYPYGARPSTATGTSPGIAGSSLGYNGATDFRGFPHNLPILSLQPLAVSSGQAAFDPWKPQLPAPMGAMDVQMQTQPPAYVSPPHPMCLFSDAVAASLVHDSQLPTVRAFEELLNEYVMSLSEKKRDKALIGQVRYNNIRAVLRDPKCTTIESAQFRFWAKKMFVLDYQADETGRTGLVVMHEGKPVAIREHLYGILTTAHIHCQHGGRDKTSSQVRQYYSWCVLDALSLFSVRP